MSVPLEAFVRSKSNLILVLIAVALIASGCGGSKPQPESETAELVVTSHSEPEISWANDWEAAFVRARAQGRPVMANFYADWCVWCKTLETITFRDQKVAALLAERVVPLNVDIEGPEQDRVRDLGVQAPPTIIIFDAEGGELGRIPGYLPPTQFLTVVEKILAGEPVALS